MKEIRKSNIMNKETNPPCPHCGKELKTKVGHTTSYWYCDCQKLKDFEKWLEEEDRQNWEILRYVETLYE